MKTNEDSSSSARIFRGLMSRSPHGDTTPHRGAAKAEIAATAPSTFDDFSGQSGETARAANSIFPCARLRDFVAKFHLLYIVPKVTIH